jgi:hypothetical protein
MRPLVELVVGTFKGLYFGLITDFLFVEDKKEKYLVDKIVTSFVEY